MSSNDIPGYFPAEPAEFESVGRGDKKVAFYNRIGYAAMSILIITAILFPLHPINGQSMYPTYDDGQKAVCTRICIGPYSQGDVVIAKTSRHMIIKRVAACPGDTITIHPDGSVDVNGMAYTYGIGSAYSSGFYSGLTKNEDGSYSATMGKGQYYLLGDNHENSADSRVYGPFGRWQITQQVLKVF